MEKESSAFIRSMISIGKQLGGAALAPSVPPGPGPPPAAQAVPRGHPITHRDTGKRGSTAEGRGSRRMVVLAGNRCQLTGFSRTEEDNSCPASRAAQNGKDSHAALPLFRRITMQLKYF